MASNDEPKNKNDDAFNDLDFLTRLARMRATGNLNPYNAPYWIGLLAIFWGFVVIQMQSDPDYGDAFAQLREGIGLTLWLSFSSYVLALIVGLLTGVLRANPPKRPTVPERPAKAIQRILYTIVYNLISVYIEFMRGIPPLVFLLIAGFIIVPAIREPFQAVINSTWIPFYNSVLLPVFSAVRGEELPPMGDWLWRGRDAATAIAGLSLIYGAFLSEVFRAGIQAVPKGQVEAAKSLGMTYFQTMRHVVIPQAIRNVLPPLGNNFISMIKDTSLVTVLGTNEITQLARRWTGSQFTYVETYAVLSMIYLTLTVTGSLLVQAMERNLRKFARD